MKNDKIKKIIINSIDPDKCEITADDIINKTNLKSQPTRRFAKVNFLKLTVSSCFILVVALTILTTVLLINHDFNKDGNVNLTMGEIKYTLPSEAEKYFTDHSSFIDINKGYVALIHDDIFVYIYRGESVISGNYTYFYAIKTYDENYDSILLEIDGKTIEIKNKLEYGTLADVSVNVKEITFNLVLDDITKTYSIKNK